MTVPEPGSSNNDAGNSDSGGLGGAAVKLPPVGWRLWSVFLGLATVTQLAFKWGGTDLEQAETVADWFAALVRSPAVGLAILGYIVMFGLWLHILQRTSLARAFLMTGLVYVTVPLAAWFIFSERIGIFHAAGIALIIAGIALMGSSGGDTESDGANPPA